MNRILAFIICLPVFGGAFAGDDALKIVTAPEVKYMLEHRNAILIHSLSRLEYDLQHIPGSINIPVVEMENSSLLPHDKKQRMIFYCMGPECSYSERACEKAQSLGYSDVLWFQGGIPEWRRFNYPLQEAESLHTIKVAKLNPQEITDLLAQGPMFILDVRPLWWQEIPYSLEGAYFMSLVDLERDYDLLPLDEKILVIDGHMKQAPSAAVFLLGKGYDVAGILKGGIARWQKEGYPLAEH